MPSVPNSPPPPPRGEPECGPEPAAPPRRPAAHPATPSAEDALREESASAEQSSNSKEMDKKPPSLFSRLFPAGGLLSTVFNISSSCVGAGIVGLPAAANSSGLALGVFYPVVIALFTIYSLYCISVLIERVGCKTYEGMAGTLLGRGVNYFACSVRILNTFGGCVAYIISIGNIVTAILTNVESAPEYLKTTSGIRLLTAGIWLFVLIPLVIPRHINSLRYVSAAGVSFIVYFVFVIIVHSCMNGLPENVKQIHLVGSTDDEGIHLFGTGNAALSAVGVFMFSFICQFNAFEIYWDMEERNAKRFTLHSAVAMCVIVFLYVATVFFGYLDFGSSVSDSVLLMYDPVKNVAVMVAYVGVLIKLCSSYTLIALATRNSIYYLLKWDAETVVFWKHCVSVLSLSLLMLLCGLFIPKINVVFGVIGGFCGGFLGFIFPALFIMYAGNWSLKSVGWFHYLTTYALLICGVIGLVFSTISTLYSVFVSN